MKTSLGRNLDQLEEGDLFMAAGKKYRVMSIDSKQVHSREERFGEIGKRRTDPRVEVGVTVIETESEKPGDRI